MTDKKGRPDEDDERETLRGDASTPAGGEPEGEFGHDLESVPR